MLDCDNCEGAGETIENNSHPYDPQEDFQRKCPDCNGTGEAQCEGCGDRAATCSAWVSDPESDRRTTHPRRRSSAVLYRICSQCLADYRDDGSFIALEVPREALVRGARAAAARADVSAMLSARAARDLARTLGEAAGVADTGKFFTPEFAVRVTSDGGAPTVYIIPMFSTVSEDLEARISAMYLCTQDVARELSAQLLAAADVADGVGKAEVAA